MTKNIFVSVIESIREQIAFDKDYAYRLSEHFGVEDIACYNNSRIIGSLIALLQLTFPKIDAFCEIEHYCFTLDFGKCGEDYESPEELYHRLFRKNAVRSWIDQERTSDFLISMSLVNELRKYNPNGI